MLTAADLAGYTTVRSDVLRSEYRGHQVCGAQPPAGGAMVASMLNTLENFDLAAIGHNTAEYIATLAEVRQHSQ